MSMLPLGHMFCYSNALVFVQGVRICASMKCLPLKTLFLLNIWKFLVSVASPPPPPLMCQVVVVCGSLLSLIST